MINYASFILIFLSSINFTARSVHFNQKESKKIENEKKKVGTEKRENPVGIIINSLHEPLKHY